MAGGVQVYLVAEDDDTPAPNRYADDAPFVSSGGGRQPTIIENVRFNDFNPPNITLLEVVNVTQDTYAPYMAPRGRGLAERGARGESAARGVGRPVAG